MWKSSKYYMLVCVCVWGGGGEVQGRGRVLARVQPY
jgi:hypothetical protein